MYLRGPLGKQLFYDFLMPSFIGTPKRSVGTPPGPRRGEEEEERRGGEEDTFQSQGLGTLRMPSRTTRTHARREHGTRFPGFRPQPPINLYVNSRLRAVCFVSKIALLNR